MTDHPPELERSAVSPASVARALNSDELALLGALLERLFPTDELGPGALEIGVLEYIQSALSGPYARLLPAYRVGLRALDDVALERWKVGFAGLASERQDAIIEDLDENRIPRADGFFDLVWQHLREGLFCDPIHGGNQRMLGWRLIGFPGAQFGYSAEEQRLDVVIRREPRSVAELQASRDERKGEPSGAS
jgi:hypothetical protein